MRPIDIAPLLALLGRLWLTRISFEPILHDVMIKLLAPEQSRISLARHGLFGRGKTLWDGLRIELIGLADSRAKGFFELGSERRCDGFIFGEQAQPHGDLFTSRDIH